MQLSARLEKLIELAVHHGDRCDHYDQQRYYPLLIADRLVTFYLSEFEFLPLLIRIEQLCHLQEVKRCAEHISKERYDHSGNNEEYGQYTAHFRRKRQYSDQF